MSDTCELCILERCTTWYYEGKYFVIIDCQTCRIPMIVLRRHSLTLTVAEQSELDNIMSYTSGMNMRGIMRKIPDHWHKHLDPR